MKVKIGLAISVLLVLSIISVMVVYFQIDKPPKLSWDESGKGQTIELVLDNESNPNLIDLKEEYMLEDVVAGSVDDYEKLQKIISWTHHQFKHDSVNTPSQNDPLTILKEASQGQNFRCVEYSIVAAASLDALGIPARVVKLREMDNGGSGYGSRHFVVEAWLKQYEKWVFADAQFDIIPESGGIPLNAVELQNALADKDLKLNLKSSGKLTLTETISYRNWVAPYLYYFDYDLDQRFYVDEKKAGEVMLVPLGAQIPRLLDFEGLRENCIYISNPKFFYLNPL